ALEESAWRESYQEVQTPIPGYELCLSFQEKEFKVHLWELCFEICFKDYQRDSVPQDSELNVDVDTSLLDSETGDVNWENLDAKVKQQVEQLFASLPQ
ncbi:MAG: hypothetical protein RI580_17835, partial [Halothece sp. Uz-M2-17]|nr:hypothetical protein [Halothece sp. Uz-M2-17]